MSRPALYNQTVKLRLREIEETLTSARAQIAMLKHYATTHKDYPLIGSLVDAQEKVEAVIGMGPEQGCGIRGCLQAMTVPAAAR
jgi:hypothetical protein